MKRILLLILLILLIGETVFSQHCLPDGINFTTQAQIDSFPMNFPNCTKIIGDVDINGDDINNLDSLISVISFNGRLTIRWNPVLSTLAGLNNVSSIDVLTFSGNYLLTDLSGFNNLDSLNSLDVSFTQSLESLNGLNDVSYIGNGIELRFNNVLNDLTALSNVGPSTGVITISDNDSLHNLSGFDGISSVIGSVSVFNSYALTDITGLENIDSIGEDLWLVEISPTNFSGLSSLGYIGGEVWIERNNELIDFSGLENLSFIGSSLRISDNDKLIRLTGLDNLHSINGGLTINLNNKLTDISGIENIEGESIIGLSIKSNPLLSECEVKSICDYLANPIGEVDIEMNDLGCNNRAEVEEACLVKIPSNDTKPEFTIFPNPANNVINISYENKTDLYKVIIYDQLGQKLLYRKRITNKIDISTLKQGLYVMEFETNGRKIRKKLIIE